MQQRNGGSKKRRSVLASKIRAILSRAYRTSRAINMAFGFGVAADEEREKKDGGGGGNEEPKTHPCDGGCLTMSCRRRPIASLSGILTCTTGLKKVATVKLRVKTMGVNEGRKKEKKKANAAAAAVEGKRELELCKKRILMGGKCRALNLSGVLHYDSRGILLPED